MFKCLMSLILSVCLAMGCVPLSVSAESSLGSVLETVDVRLVVNGDVHKFAAIEFENEYYYTREDLYVALPDFDTNRARTYAYKNQEYFCLSDICRTADVFYTHDDVLDADYVWTYPDVKAPKSSSDDELNRAAELGIYSTDADKTTIRYCDFFPMLDRVVELADETKLATWKALFPEARTATDCMTRFEGMMAVMRCAVTLGGDYADFNYNSGPVHRRIGEKFGDEIERIKPSPFRYIPDSFPNTYSGGGFESSHSVYEWYDHAVAYFYAFGRISLVSNKTLFEYDSEANSMLPDKPFTREAAVLAALRLLESSAYDETLISLSDERAIKPDATIITPELVARANERPVVSDDNLPIWKGFVIGWDYCTTRLPASESDLRDVANWGFNSVRLMVTYQTFFDTRVSEVDLNKLKQLDQLVASAMKYNLHLNLVTFSMPGRWTKNDAKDFTSIGEFDLFTNRERQKEANAIWALLSERYKDVPSSSLSFSPIWEPFNKNLSSGLPYKPYKASDVVKVYDKLVGTIKQYDPDRFVIYEPTETNGADGIIEQATLIRQKIESKYEGTQMLTNFCAAPFVYANMTAEVGAHIDNNNHSIFKGEDAYPTTIFALQRKIGREEPLEMTGELVKGTLFDVYLKQVSGKGELKITADGEQLYSEQLEKAEYDVGYPLSVYYPFAKSDKLISFTLDSDVRKLEISFSGKSLEWSGIYITLPAEYAVKRWYFPTEYDAFLEGSDRNQDPYLRDTSSIMLSPNVDTGARHIVINADVSFSSESIWEQANKDTIESWARAISEFAPRSVVRFEDARFGGCPQTAALHYYTDLLSALKKYNLGWYSNDYINIREPGARHTLAGSVAVNYGDGVINVDLMKLLQTWQ